MGPQARPGQTRDDRPDRARARRPGRRAWRLAALLLLSPAGTRSQPAAAGETDRRAALARHLSVARSADVGDCPDTALLAAAVEPLLTGPHLLDVHVDVQITRSGRRYEAHLRVNGERLGQRSLDDDSSSCAPLADALAVTVAMMLQGRDETPTVAPSGSSTPPPAPRPPATRGRPPEVSLRLAAETTAGLTARGTTGPAAEVGVRLGSGLALGLGGSYLPPASYALDAGRVDVSLATARLRGCWLREPGAGAVHVGLCGLASVGQMVGEGLGFTRDRRPARPWVATGVGVAAGGSLGDRFGWLVEAGALVPWERKSFSVDRLGDGPVFQEAPVGGFVRFGLETKIF